MSNPLKVLLLLIGGISYSYMLYFLILYKKLITLLFISILLIRLLCDQYQKRLVWEQPSRIDPWVESNVIRLIAHQKIFYREYLTPSAAIVVILAYVSALLLYPIVTILGLNHLITYFIEVIKSNYNFNFIQPTCKPPHHHHFKGLASYSYYIKWCVYRRIDVLYEQAAQRNPRFYWYARVRAGLDILFLGLIGLPIRFIRIYYFMYLLISYLWDPKHYKFKSKYYAWRICFQLIPASLSYMWFYSKLIY